MSEPVHDDPRTEVQHDGDDTRDVMVTIPVQPVATEETHDNTSNVETNVVEASPPPPPPTANAPPKISLTFVYIAVAIDFMGLSLVLPLLPYYGRSLNASGALIGLIYSGFSFFQFFSVIVSGIISDKKGRRYVLLAQILGPAVGLLWSGLATTYVSFLMSRCFTGALSGAASVAGGYIADVRKGKEKDLAMGKLAAIISFAFAIGPFFSGVLAQRDLRIPFFVASALSFLSFFLALFKLKESKVKVNTAAPTLVAVTTTGSETPKDSSVLEQSKPVPMPEPKPEAVLTPIDRKLSDEKLDAQAAAAIVLTKDLKTPASAFPKWVNNTVIAAGFLFVGLMSGFYTTYGLLLLDKFDIRQLAYGIIAGGISVANLLILPSLKPLLHLVGKHALIVISSVLLSIGVVPLPFLETFYHHIPFLVIIAFAQAYFLPNQNALISRYTPDSMQGKRQGMNHAFQALARVFGPLFAGIMYDVAQYLPYVVLGPLPCIGAVLILVVISANRKTKVQFMAARQAELSQIDGGVVGDVVN